MEDVGDAWLERYRGEIETYQAAAKIAEEIIGDVFAGIPIAIHSVTARAKSPGSAARKIKRKKYASPQSQMNDVVGVRIITSYAQGVEEVVRRLKDRYEIDENNSIDKRQALGTGMVGYRSVHLVLKLGKVGRADDAAKLLTEIKIEVQVRSVIEHAWAEIEHELRYKSGLTLPEEIQRRFTVAAGTLELVDSEFDRLADELADLAFKHRDRYNSGGALEEAFDSSRLMGYLLARRPDLSPSGPRKLPLPFERACECVEILKELGITTAKKLDSIIDDESFRSLVRNYADRRDIEPNTVSALVLVMIAGSLIDRDVIKRSALLSDQVFEEMFEDV
jgi:ppGpp synthetase/RelA/SpoT-type nucleotidyltranferase